MSLASEVSELLIDIIYSTIKSDKNTFVTKLMEYEIVPDVIALSADVNHSVQTRLIYILLLNKIIEAEPTYLKGILRDGMCSCLAEIGREIFEASHIEDKVLSKYLQSMISILIASKTNSASKGQLNNLVSLRLHRLKYLLAIL